MYCFDAPTLIESPSPISAARSVIFGLIAITSIGGGGPNGTARKPSNANSWCSIFMSLPRSASRSEPTNARVAPSGLSIFRPSFATRVGSPRPTATRTRPGPISESERSSIAVMPGWRPAVERPTSPTSSFFVARIAIVAGTTAS